MDGGQRVELKMRVIVVEETAKVVEGEAGK